MKLQRIHSALLGITLALLAVSAFPATASASPVTLYAVDARGNLYSLHTGTGEVQSVSAAIGFLGFAPPSTGVGGAYAGLDFNPVNGQLYVSNANNPGGGSIYTVNTSTAATTLVTTVAPAMINVTQNLAFSPTGVLYGSESTALFTINLATGATTASGSHGFPPDDNGLAFAPNGTFYGVGGPIAGGEDLYTINPANHAVTLINPSTPCIVGLTFAVDGNLYCTGLDANPTARAGRLYQINPTTGVATFMMDTGLDIADLANSSAATAVPEPATLTLLLAPALAGLVLRRRSRMRAGR